MNERGNSIWTSKETSKSREQGIEVERTRYNPMEIEEDPIWNGKEETICIEKDCRPIQNLYFPINGPKYKYPIEVCTSNDRLTFPPNRAFLGEERNRVVQMEYPVTRILQKGTRVFDKLLA